jgi:hypothetical protein
MDKHVAQNTTGRNQELLEAGAFELSGGAAAAVGGIGRVRCGGGAVGARRGVALRDLAGVLLSDSGARTTNFALQLGHAISAPINSARRILIRTWQLGQVVRNRGSSDDISKLPQFDNLRSIKRAGLNRV